MTQEELNALANEFYDYLANQKDFYEVWPSEDDTICVDVSWGDWKHDHLRLDLVAKDFFNEKGYDILNMDTDVTDEDGSDTYSATHSYRIRKHEEEPKEYKMIDSSEIKVEEDVDTHHGDVDNASFVVVADNEKFGFDTKDDAEDFMRRNQNSFEKLDLVVKESLEDGQLKYGIHIHRKNGDYDMYGETFNSIEEAKKEIEDIIKNFGKDYKDEHFVDYCDILDLETSTNKKVERVYAKDIKESSDENLKEGHLGKSYKGYTLDWNEDELDSVLDDPNRRPTITILDIEGKEVKDAGAFSSYADARKWVDAHPINVSEQVARIFATGLREINSNLVLDDVTTEDDYTSLDFVYDTTATGGEVQDVTFYFNKDGSITCLRDELVSDEESDISETKYSSLENFFNDDYNWVARYLKTNKDFVNSVLNKVSKYSFKESLDNKEVLKEESNDKGNRIAKLIARAYKGMVGPFGGEDPYLDGNKVTFHSQGPSESWIFNDDGSVDSAETIEDLLSIAKPEDYGCESEEELRDYFESISHFDSVRDLFDSGLSWFMEVPHEEELLRKIDNILSESLREDVESKVRLENPRLASWAEYYLRDVCGGDVDEYNELYADSVENDFGDEPCQFFFDVLDDKDNYLGKIGIYLFDGMGMWYEIGFEPNEKYLNKEKLELEDMDLPVEGWFPEDSVIKSEDGLLKTEEQAKEYLRPYLAKIESALEYSEDEFEDED